MKRFTQLALLLGLIFLGLFSGKVFAEDDDLYSFDVEEFTKNVPFPRKLSIVRI